MTDTISIAPDADTNAGRSRGDGNLSTMLLPELKKVAHDMGLGQFLSKAGVAGWRGVPPGLSRPTQVEKVES